MESSFDKIAQTHTYISLSDIYNSDKCLINYKDYKLFRVDNDFYLIKEKQKSNLHTLFKNTN